MPLAAWLQEVGTSISDATLHGTHRSRSAIRSSRHRCSTHSKSGHGGLDVKYILAAPLWPTVGAEVSGSMQKTNTIVITLNGLDSQAAYFVAIQRRRRKTTSAPKALPTIDVSVPATRSCRPMFGETAARPAVVARSLISPRKAFDGGGQSSARAAETLSTAPQRRTPRPKAKTAPPSGDLAGLATRPIGKQRRDPSSPGLVNFSIRRTWPDGVHANAFLRHLACQTVGEGASPLLAAA